MEQGLGNAQLKGPFSSVVSWVTETATWIFSPEFRAESRLTPAEKEAWDGIKDISSAYYRTLYAKANVASLMAGLIERIDCKTTGGLCFTLTRTSHTLRNGGWVEAIVPSGRDSNQLRFLTHPLLSSLFETAKLHARSGAETSEAS
jgi:hypothetical protein